MRIKLAQEVFSHCGYVDHIIFPFSRLGTMSNVVYDIDFTIKCGPSSHQVLETASVMGTFYKTANVKWTVFVFYSIYPGVGSPALGRLALLVMDTPLYSLQLVTITAA